MTWTQYKSLRTACTNTENSRVEKILKKLMPGEFFLIQPQLIENDMPGMFCLSDRMPSLRAWLKNVSLSL